MGDIGDIMGGGFDANSVEAATGFDPVPAGWYDVSVDNAEVTMTKNGNGQYLKVEMTIVGEQYANRKLFDNITLANPNSTAVEIGQRSLAALALACGINTITDSAELLGKYIQARVKVKPAQYKKDPQGNLTQEVLYEAGNDVTAYKPCACTPHAPVQQPQQQYQQPAQQAPVQQQPVQQQVAGTQTSRPWER